MLLPFILLEAVGKDVVGVTASLGKDAEKREGKLSKGTARSSPGSLELCGVATSTLKWVGAGWGYPKRLCVLENFTRGVLKCAARSEALNQPTMGL